MTKHAALPKPRFRSILKWAGRVITTVLILLVLFVAIIRLTTYLSNRITAANGVDDGIYVTLAGQEQYLLIRGEDTANPVIIWLHGGPTSPDAFVNHTFQKYLVDDYTIINWDQRGCGRTYFHNAKDDPSNLTVTFDQAQADLDALVDYACDRFDTEKVILVGHSYGTMLGSQYALTHPEKISAYIGVAQFVTIESEEYSYQDALAAALSHGEDTAEMESAYAQYLENPNIFTVMNLRKTVHPYHIPEKEANTLWLGISSPYMGLQDLRWFLKQAGNFEDYIALNPSLFEYIMVTDVRGYGLDYSVPVGFLSGSCDWTTPVKYTEDYYNLIAAPQKLFCLIDGCGHSPQYDAPEEFSTQLKAMLDTLLA